MLNKSEKGAKNIEEQVKAEAGMPGPASPELCKALGIDPKDLQDALPPTKAGSSSVYGSKPQTASKPSEKRKSGLDLYMEKAAQTLQEESVRTKEHVITTVATYLANKNDSWWSSPAQFRDREVFFLIKMLVHAQTVMEEP